MSTHRNIDKICCVVLVFVLILTLLFMNGEKLGIQAVSAMQYEASLFDDSRVHTIDIEMDDWGAFLESCENEEYEECSVTIDGETYSNVGIRAKGNTSLSSVKAYGNNRYSFKIEFDQYDSGKSYYGLDKLCLNNIIQDNTYMKDYLVYTMMKDFGVDSPLCSFVYITVGGEEWGLYLAVEGAEESFLERNYGNDYGELYKPDSMNMGGGRGNGKDFDQENMEQFFGDTQAAEPPQGFSADQEDEEANGSASGEEDSGGQRDKGFREGKDVDAEVSDSGPGGGFDAESGGDSGPDGGFDAGNGGDSGPGSGFDAGNGGGPGGGGGMMSDDVSLIYTDDEYDSYSNIFDNAKTDITDADKDRLIASLKQMNEGENIEDVVNVEEVIRYFVVHNFVCNFDSYTGSIIHNYYLYEDDGKLSMIPWDYNLAFGGFQAGAPGASDTSDATGMVNYPIDTPVSGGTVDSRPMLAWIFNDESYTQVYHEYFSDFIEQYFGSGYFEQLMDSVTEMISPYVEKDPTAFCTYEEFRTGAETLKQFCLLRAESVRGQLDGTIPSTSEGQQEDSSALVDASSVTLSDMGDMGNTMGGRGGHGMPDGGFGGDSARNGGNNNGEAFSDTGASGSPPDVNMSGGDTGTADSPPDVNVDGADNGMSGAGGSAGEAAGSSQG